MVNEELSFDDLEPEGESADIPEDSVHRADVEANDRRDELGEYQFGWPEDEEAVFEDWEDDNEFSGNGYRKQRHSRKHHSMANLAARTARKWGYAATTNTVMRGREQPQARARVRRPPGLDSFEHEYLYERNAGRPGSLTDGREPSISSAALVEAHELTDRLATAASRAQDGAEATGLVAATVPLIIALYPSAYRALWPAMPALIKGAMGVTKLLRGRPNTRPLIGLMPAILRSAAADLAGYAGDGRPITNQLVARVLARRTAAVLSRHGSDHGPSWRASEKRRKRANYSRTETDDDWWDDDRWDVDDYGL